MTTPKGEKKAKAKRRVRRATSPPPPEPAATVAVALRSGWYSNLTGRKIQPDMDPPPDDDGQGDED